MVVEIFASVERAPRFPGVKDRPDDRKNDEKFGSLHENLIFQFWAALPGARHLERCLAH